MSVEVTEADKTRADLYYASRGMLRAQGATDNDPIAMLIADVRHQAEDAMRERCASYVDGKGGVIPGATVFISLITGDSMPCMSGDGRDKLNPHRRRQFDDATRDLAAAIRSIDTRGE